jgi:hypothetical protein
LVKGRICAEQRYVLHFFCLHKYEESKTANILWSNPRFGSLQSPPRENHPAVKCGCTTRAAATGLDSDGKSGALDDIAEANVSIANESRQAHSIRLAFILMCCATALFLFLFHDIRLRA